MAASIPWRDAARMAEAIGLESLRWKGLALLSVARFTAVIDRSIVNVALGA
jgi:hypothetical protein